MKNILRKIAILLLIVMCCNILIGCAEMIVLGIYGFAYTVIGAIAVGAVIGLIVGIVEVGILKERGPRRTNPYLYENSTLTTTISSLSEEDLDSLKKTLQSLPERELNSFIWILNLMSEKETISLMDSISSFSAQELSAIIGSLNSMSETEKNSSIKTLNSRPNTVFLPDIVRNLEVDVPKERVYMNPRFKY